MKPGRGKASDWFRVHCQWVFTVLFGLSVALGAFVSSTPDCVGVLDRWQAPTTDEYVCRDGQLIPIDLGTVGIEKAESSEFGVEAFSDRGVFGSCTPPLSWGVWFVTSSIVLAGFASWSGKSAQQVSRRSSSLMFGWWFAVGVSFIAVVLLFAPHFRYPDGLVPSQTLESVRASFLEMSVPAIISVFPLIRRRKRKTSKSSKKK